MFLLPAVASGTPTLNTIHHCDALTLLRALPAGSVDCVVTSPPYYGLRDYQTGRWVGGNPDCDHKPNNADKGHIAHSTLNGGLKTNAAQIAGYRNTCKKCGATRIDDQIGLEDTPAIFIEKLMAIFREVHRVLKPTGNAWINLGDSYANDTKWGGSTGGKHVEGLRGQTGIGRGKTSTGLPPKSLMMIPARFAIAMQDSGWILRSEIVWAKRAPMPESVTDRPTKSHEMIYLFAKQGSYWYDQEAVRERASINSHGSPRVNPGQKQITIRQNLTGSLGKFNPNENNGRNLRDVWHLSPEPTSAEHFAAFPTEIPRRCILAGCPEQVCAVCGKPYERHVDREGIALRPNSDSIRGNSPSSKRAGDANPQRGARATVTIDRGLQPACSCNAETRPGIVLDFFMGTGTVAYMARKLGRNYIGCDLNADYVTMARRRLAQSDPYQSREVAPGLIQKSMFSGMSV